MNGARFGSTTDNTAQDMGTIIVCLALCCMVCYTRYSIPESISDIDDLNDTSVCTIFEEKQSVTYQIHRPEACSVSPITLMVLPQPCQPAIAITSKVC